jgi:VIT1/CCC1 family predicted Fe2+/Mn2+ transporter
MITNVMPTNLEKFQQNSKHKLDTLRNYMADIVYGANDGVITTFTLISGVEGAKFPSFIIIVLGFVNLFADGISMGASSYLSFRSNAAMKGDSCGYLESFYHGFATFLAFILCGAVPLISFLIPKFYEYQFLISCIMTAIVLFLIGALRIIIIVKKRWLKSGLEMLLVGGIAATLGYIIGNVLVRWLGTITKTI